MSELERYRDGIDVGREQIRAEVERLTAERDEARVAWADWQKSSEAYRANVARLRRLLRAVVQEADRSTRAFDEARAELELEA